MLMFSSDVITGLGQNSNRSKVLARQGRNLIFLGTGAEVYIRYGLSYEKVYH